MLATSLGASINQLKVKPKVSVFGTIFTAISNGANDFVLSLLCTLKYYKPNASFNKIPTTIFLEIDFKGSSVITFYISYYDSSTTLCYALCIL